MTEQRASDADRERVVAALREAAADGRIDVDELDDRASTAFAARTVADLRRLTEDLGPSALVASSGRAAATAPIVRADPADPGTRTIVSIMGGSDHRGRWRVGAACRVVCLMGGADLDLTDAELSAADTTITVLAVMGGADLRLPTGADVRVAKFALMGGHDIRLDPESPPPGAPVIRLRLFSLMGGTKVRQGASRKRKRIGGR